MIRILHAADLHLDSPFAALRPEQAAARRQEQRELLNRLAAACRELDCSVLLLAGDLFDSGQVYRETMEALRQALAGCGARVFIAPGNHDPYTPWSAYSTVTWPENVTIFRHPAITGIRLREPDLVVYGAGFTAPKAPPLLRGFRAEEEGVPRVLVIHGEITAGTGFYNPISPEDVRDSGLDYLALGHIHAQSVRTIGTTTVGTPGCAMGRGFDETGDKGALLVELEPGSCRVTPVSLGARQYRICRVRSEGDPMEAILRALPEDTSRDIYRIILTGTWDRPDPSGLQKLLAERFYGLELVDQTMPPLELWSALNEDSLRGEFLRRLRQRCDNADEKGQKTAALAAELVLSLMDGREVPECCASES